MNLSRCVRVHAFRMYRRSDLQIGFNRRGIDGRGLVAIVARMRRAGELAPMIPLDAAGRPAWLFARTVHEGCDRGGYYEQGDFADAYGSPQCIVKLGCWGPVVNCNVGKRAWINGIGGCPNVGGICIGCTMPGFPDKFMPFMNQPPGSLLSSYAVSTYGRAIKALRKFTQSSLNGVPEWRRPESSAEDPIRTA